MCNAITEQGTQCKFAGKFDGYCSRHVTHKNIVIPTFDEFIVGALTTTENPIDYINKYYRYFKEYRPNYITLITDLIQKYKPLFSQEFLDKLKGYDFHNLYIRDIKEYIKQYEILDSEYYYEFIIDFTKLVVFIEIAHYDIRKTTVKLYRKAIKKLQKKQIEKSLPFVSKDILDYVLEQYL